MLFIDLPIENVAGTVADAASIGGMRTLAASATSAAT
jgi:hypothetical protein